MENIPHSDPQSKRIRALLTEHIALFDDPILKALQGRGLSPLEVAVIWIDLEEEASRVYGETLRDTNSTIEAFKKITTIRKELAVELIAAKGW